MLTLVVAVVVVSVVEFDAVVVVIELYLLKYFSVSRSQQSRLEVVNYERLCRYCFTLLLLLLLLLLILLLFFGCRCCLQSIVVDVGVDFSDVVIVLVGVDIVDFNCCCRCRLVLLLLLSW